MLTKMEPMLINIMGVSGSGKSTLAKKVADKAQIEYVDADDFHSTDAKNLMAKGIGLTEEIRIAWIERLCTFLSEKAAANISCVLAYSGLKQHHRAKIAASYAYSQHYFIDLPFDVLEHRLASRKHFFNPRLLADQFDQLEPFDNDENVILLDGKRHSNALAKQIISKHFESTNSN
ncbi:gluconokinase [Glaciecola sp. 1036]|uniref:gluconokinase n=1 Tax=Alteromonadaceae TaxID=72275 RepID=UPI003D02A102